jgi:hypothetical protein
LDDGFLVLLADDDDDDAVLLALVDALAVLVVGRTGLGASDSSSVIS